MKTPAYAKFIRYAMVSVISTVMSIALLYTFYRGVGLTAGWANVVATCICTVPSYYLNRTWTWGRSGKSHFMREVFPFWVIAFISLGLSTGAVWFAAREADHSHLTHHVQTLLVLFANFFTYGVIWVGKFLLFNRILFKHEPPTEEPIVLVPAVIDSTDEPKRSLVTTAPREPEGDEPATPVA
ncbi:MAG TPA: GtrA family protein, partial [Acidimicrobiales bacterium]|nr:GtrA family protein [Acidimicrobiales bacterium]